jgi:quercetin dioxygenase-like cupin family protein
MAFLKQSDPEYWSSPGRFAQLDRVIPSVKHTYFVLGDAEKEEGQAALVMKMEPGHVINSHGHSSSVFEVIVAGSMEVDGVRYEPGDVMVLEPGEPCGTAVVGPDGCTTVEFFSTVPGAYQLVYEGKDGEKIQWDSLAAKGRPDASELKTP